MKIGLENYFAVPVMYGFLDRTVVDNSLKISKQYIVSNDWQSKPLTGKTITTYHSDNTLNYLGLVGDTVLLEKINSISRKFLDLLGLDSSMDLLIENWLNLNPRLSGHYQHEHYASIISGVLYLETDSQDGDLMFYDPIKTRSQAQAYNKKSKININQYNFQSITVTPEVGKIVLFESWLTHAVSLNLTNSNRISIAFNVFRDERTQLKWPE
jgi:uncharacterized protein (TIGR02466 family)